MNLYKTNGSKDEQNVIFSGNRSRHHKTQTKTWRDV